MTEYICPRCSTVFNNDIDDDLWFIINAGYVEMGCCPECKTHKESKVISKTWKDYITNLFGANK
jgi:phage FluMu protein Com